MMVMHLCKRRNDNGFGILNAVVTVMQMIKNCVYFYRSSI